RADFALLLFATPETALRRLGQSRQAAAGVGAWRPRPLPQLGLGRARSAQPLSRYRAGPSRPRRLRLGRGQRLFDDRLRARPLTAHERRGQRARDAYRPLARRWNRFAIYRDAS